MLILENKVKTNKGPFLEKVKEVSSDLDIDPNWLMAVMNSESNIDSAAVNPVSGATGLIQFMPRTAKGLGTTTTALKAMGNVEQLDYVKKYFNPYKYRITTFGDLYMATFFPVAIGKDDDYVLETKNLPASLIAKQNPIFDLNKDSKITAGEVRKAFLMRVPAQYRDKMKGEKDSVTKMVVRNKVPIIVAFGIIGVTGAVILLLKN